MKAEELQLNDLVNYEGHATSVQVLRLGENIRNIGVESPFGNVFPKEDEIQPIPLTAEILKINGFQQKNGELVWYSDTDSIDNVFISVATRGNNSVRRIEIKNKGLHFANDVMPDGIAVHEFQHLLRVCGFNDLADNFKVE